MIIHEQQVREQNIRQVAEQMMLAAKSTDVRTENFLPKH